MNPLEPLEPKFVKAILNKSAILGLQGEITAAYLRKLGFTEEKDFTVIGCPVVFMNGDELEVEQSERKRKYYYHLVTGKCLRMVDASRRRNIRVGEE